MVDGDGGETDNGMKPASMPCTPCGSREAGSAREFDIFTDGFDIPPPPLRRMNSNDWQHFESGGKWLAWNRRTGETCGGAGSASELNIFTGEIGTPEWRRHRLDRTRSSRIRWIIHLPGDVSKDSSYKSSDVTGSNGNESVMTLPVIARPTPGTTDSPSGGNAVVRGEAGAKGATPMTIAELRDSDMHDVVGQTLVCQIPNREGSDVAINEGSDVAITPERRGAKSSMLAKTEPRDSDSYNSRDATSSSGNAAAKALSATVLVGAVLSTTDSPSGGNAVVRGEAGA